MKNLFLVFIMASIFSSCSLFSSSGEEIDLAYSNWKQNGSSSYQFEYNYDCFCPIAGKSIISVKERKVHSVLDPSTNDLFMVQVRVEPDSMAYVLDVYPELFKTIDQLFQVVYDAKKRDADKITERYNTVVGYPSEIFIDYDIQFADDEFGFSISNYSDARPVVFN